MKIFWYGIIAGVWQKSEDPVTGMECKHAIQIMNRESIQILRWLASEMRL